ncbi:VWA domain-containing protein [Streptomyces sp. NPDC057543]|uniref:VWA domain-containing protein n=1 Tax=Streptomyces sp. NPDC057543 TaxID=3346163 RepID=UPI0036B2E2BC
MQRAPAISLSKVQERAPDLVSLYKVAGDSIRGHGLEGVRAAVYLVLDRSGSMRPYYRDGTMQHLAEQVLSLSAHLDDDGIVPVVFFSTDVDGSTDLTLGGHRGRINKLHENLGHMGRTNYHWAMDEVIDHYMESGSLSPALVIFQTDGGPTSKLAERAAERAEQLAAIDPDWNCPWRLDWQRHYKVLADLVDADGHLPDIAPGVLFDGDDIGRWLTRQREPHTWAQLLPEQQERLTKLGVQPTEAPYPASAAKGAAKQRPSKAQQAFQRGLAALTQWVEREGSDRPVPRKAVETLPDGTETKLGIWYSNTKTRRDKLTPEQLNALAALGLKWAAA